MKKVPQEILDQFIRVYTDKSLNLIPFGGGEESSDGIVYRFSGKLSNQLIKIMFFKEQEYEQAIKVLSARLTFMDFLYRSGVPVVRLVPSSKGNIFETLQNNEGIWTAYAMEKVEGQVPSPNALAPEVIRNWGQAIGKLHRATQNYPTWQGITDKTTGNQHLTWEEEWQHFFDICEEKDIQEQWVNIRVILRTYPIQQDCFGFIHNDPHLWNLSVHKNQVTILDFDVANHQWFANDIAIACQHVLFMHSGGLSQPIKDRDCLIDFLQKFLSGYRKENDFDQEWLLRLDTFIDYRRILLYLVMPGWRQSDPSLQESWKKMIMTAPAIFSEQ
jgi:amicoumacin kinase